MMLIIALNVPDELKAEAVLAVAHMEYDSGFEATHVALIDTLDGTLETPAYLDFPTL